MNDDELRSALSQRASRSLSSDERNDILRAARIAATQPPRRSLMPRLGGAVLAIAAALVLAIIALPILLSPPGPARPSSSPGVDVLNTQQLIDLAQSGASVGGVVIADATIVPFTGPSPSCEPAIPCPIGELGESGGFPVTSGYRDAGSTQGTAVAFEVDGGDINRWITPLALPGLHQRSAFLILDTSVEYLGPAHVAASGGPLAISDLPVEAEKAPTDNVYVVHGWWWSGLWPNCPAYPQPTPPIELDFYCNGFWLTADRPDTTHTMGSADALLLAAGAYPAWSDQHSPGAPVEGTYVVRSAGCQVTLDNRCPVWRLVGRLDYNPTATPTAEPSPAPESPVVPATPISASPTPVATTALPIVSEQALADLVGDPDWVGKAVLAHLSAGAIAHDPCPSPLGTPLNACNRGSLFDVHGPFASVLVGLRDATSFDGVQQDDGNGYHWVTPLEWPTDAGVYAFTVGNDSVDYLGPVQMNNRDTPYAVSDLSGSKSDPTDVVYVVNGWLGHTVEAPCAFPQQGLASPMPDISSYYCGGSWLADHQWGPPTSGLSVDGGLHVQNDAYSTYAPNPDSSGQGGASRLGTYLIRNAGCPEVVTGDCPVWRMVGRLDDASSSAEPSPSPTSSAAPKALPFYVNNGTTMELRISVDGQPLGTSEPDTISKFDPTGFAQPWVVTLTTTAGRPVSGITYSPADIGTNAGGTNPESGRAVGRRLDLSCGRLDVYAGGPMSGPTFIPSSDPTDCDVSEPPSPTPASLPTPNWSPQPLSLTTGSTDHPPCGASYLDGTLIYDNVDPTNDQLNMGIVPAGEITETDVIWPHGYTAIYDLPGQLQMDAVGGPAVIDDKGNLVARYGDYVRIFGGAQPSPSVSVFDACAGLQRLGPDGSPLPSPLPNGYVGYVNLNQATAIADHAYKFGGIPKSYAAGPYQNVVQELFGQLGNPPVGDASRDALVWGVVADDGINVQTVYIDLLTGRVLGIDVRDSPVDYASFKSTITFESPVVHVSNGTALGVSVYVNGALATSSGDVSFDPGDFAAAPWTVTARTSSGRQLASEVLDPTQLWQTSGDTQQDSGWLERVDLSCGRLDLWAGAQPSGPAPFGSYPPGDCNP